MAAIGLTPTFGPTDLNSRRPHLQADVGFGGGSRPLFTEEATRVAAPARDRLEVELGPEQAQHRHLG